jgi:hypothetical protein
MTFFRADAPMLKLPNMSCVASLGAVSWEASYAFRLATRPSL